MRHGKPFAGTCVRTCSHTLQYNAVKCARIHARQRIMRPVCNNLFSNCIIWFKYVITYCVKFMYLIQTSLFLPHKNTMCCITLVSNALLHPPSSHASQASAQSTCLQNFREYDYYINEYMLPYRDATSCCCYTFCLIS